MASLKYFLIRTVLFVVPFAVFMVLGIGAMLSAIYAVIIAFAVNFLFLNRQRNAAAGEVRDVFSGRKEVRTKQELKDAEVEDAIDDAQRGQEGNAQGATGASTGSAPGERTKGPGGAESADGHDTGEPNDAGPGTRPQL